MMNIDLKEIRREKSYTQQELAELLNISLRTYQRWENNPEYLNLSDLFILESELDINLVSKKDNPFNFEIGADISFHFGEQYWKQSIPDGTNKKYYLFEIQNLREFIEVRGYTCFTNFNRTLLPNEEHDYPILLENRTLRRVHPPSAITLFFSFYKKLPLVIDDNLNDHDLVWKVFTVRKYGGLVLIQKELCELFFPNCIDFPDVTQHKISQKNLKYSEL